MSRIAFLSLPAYGHVNPLLPIVAELVRALPRVRQTQYQRWLPPHLEVELRARRFLDVAGARELVALPFGTIARGEGFVTVRGKGGKERLVPIGGGARAALDAYLAIRAKFLQPGKPARWRNWLRRKARPRARSRP